MKFLIRPLYDLYRKAIRHSQLRWLIILGSLVYLISPIDLSTDLLPVVGWLDDGVIVTILLTELSQIVLEQRQARKLKESQPASPANVTIEASAEAV